MSQISLSQQAYERIKQKIVALELPPGAVIDEAALQQELELGRTPIREALKRLSLEKLVVIVPRRGMFVTDIGISDLQQLFEVRLALESLAARLAARRGGAHQWQRMAAALEGLTADSPSNEALIEMDKTCHELIYEAADNQFLRDTCVTHYALSLRLWHYFLRKMGAMRGAVIEHVYILEALRAGDADQAARLMEKHIRAFQEEIQSVMLGAPQPVDAVTST
ncbi:MAG: GntR family transcriptional regulator [Candidatus Promineifilaceae bacterium]|nr:GntR family transcriptional regulator [Candidatus Promineifilaceae bacterium]